MKSFINFINEGRVVTFRNVKSGNFVVLLGIPGSGKTFVSNNLIDLQNVRIFNVDSERELMAKKMNIDLSNPIGNREILKYTHRQMDPRNRTVRVLKNFLQTTKSLTNIIYDTVGTHQELMREIVTLANNIGYTTTLIYVKCDLRVALTRNKNRNRVLDDSTIIQYYNIIEESFNDLKSIYDRVWIVDNNSENNIKINPLR